MSNPFVATLVYFIACGAFLLVSFFVIEVTTKYNDWEEIKKGNVSVSIATSGKLLGIANILRFAISGNDNIGQTLLWGLVGLVLLIFIYFLFNAVTPKINLDDAIAKDNRAVAILSFFISLSFSFIIGPSIT
ncbi:DUF350 domain-containing protein [Alicyclobacillus sp. SO9]|uniref:DUF350 domain-containing protein n=1 Tax=Alicyclobacillus sp. SO9 TaxID=2665646 RepID=UPI001E50E5CF|nr:DUF350 domain-containing protein [Alicyclobacillus sp. SO9]